MSVRVFYDILNQKGTPAFYTDTLANRPVYGYAGRVFISTDSGQIFEDTGSAWTLIADAGVGGGTLSSVCLNGNTTATGIVITAGGLSSNSITNTSLTAGSVLFAGTSGLESESNSTFFWDNTNKRLGIGNASPGAPLDIHGTGTQIQINGTGTNNSYIQFQNAGVSKWRIGNTYASASNNFEIYNNSTSTTLLSIISNNIFFPIGISAVGGIAFPSTISGSNYGAIIGSSSYFQIAAQNGSTILIQSSNGTNALTINTTGNVNFGNTIGNGTYTYTLPSATGTLALTSNLSSYLPLTGGTLTGYILINNALGSNQIYLPKSSGDVYGTIQTEAGGNKFSLGNVSNIGTLGTAVITWTSGLQVGINNTSPTYDFDVTGTGRFTGAAYFGTTSGNIGLGTTTIDTSGGLYKCVTIDSATYSRYSLQSSGVPKGRFQFDATNVSLLATSTGGKLQLQTLGANAIELFTNDTLRTTITSGGNVLIGTTTDNGSKLQVSGDINASNGVTATTVFSLNKAGANAIGDGPYYKYVNTTNAAQFLRQLNASSGEDLWTYNTTTIWTKVGNTNASTGVYTALSDINKKKDFELSTLGLNAIRGLKPTLYRMKSENDTINKHLGFLAQEVKEYIPQAYIEFGENEGKFIGLNYDSITATLVKAIQELDEKLVRNNIN